MSRFDPVPRLRALASDVGIDLDMARSYVDGFRSFLDSTIGIFSPASELRRMQARLVIDRIERSFDGAARGRRTQNWHTANSSINAIIAGGLPALRSRSRDLGRNNPWAKKAVEAIVGNTIGKGIIPQARGKNPALAATLDALWDEWGDEALCDADQRLDFYGLQSLVMQTVAESGSCLIRRRWRRASDGLPVPMQLQLLEPDYLDVTRDAALKNGGRIIQGIEFDARGRRVAYWLYPQHPGDRVLISSKGFVSTRVSAADVLHVYRMDRIGQVDGVPWGAACIIRIRDLDEFEDAQLVRQKIAACFAGFIHDIEADGDISGNDEAKDILERVEPGILQKLPPGKSITFGTPPPADGYGEYTTVVLRSIAAGYGVTYEAMTGDYSQVNFSSGRMGWLEFQRNLGRWQEQMILPQLNKPVWRWFCEAAIVAGRVSDFAPASWTAPRREMIDPGKETDALKLGVRSGLMTLSEAIRQTGQDPAAVFAEREAENKIIDQKNLILDSDPRRVQGSGASQPALPAAPE